MIPDPGALLFIVIIGLMGWAVFKMLTRPEPEPFFDGGFEEPETTTPEEETRRSQV